MFFESLSGELRVRLRRPRVGAGRGSIVAARVEVSRQAIGEAVADGVGERLGRSKRSAEKSAERGATKAERVA